MSGGDRSSVCIVVECVAGVVEVELVNSAKNLPFVCEKLREKQGVNRSLVLENRAN